MKRAILGFLFIIIFLPSASFAETSGQINFTEPKNGAKVKNPVKVCFGQKGLNVVEWSKTNVDGEGHHHLIIDNDFPKDLGKFASNSSSYIVHYRKNCKTLRKPLSKGKHVLRGIFTHNNHAPYDPLIGATVTIEVVE